MPCSPRLLLLLSARGGAVGARCDRGSRSGRTGRPDYLRTTRPAAGRNRGGSPAGRPEESGGYFGEGRLDIGPDGALLGRARHRVQHELDLEGVDERGRRVGTGG